MKACAAPWRIWRRTNPGTAVTQNALLGRRNWRKARRGWTRRFQRAAAKRYVRPWILDIDTTVKLLYGHQAGAEVGYNPTKPGRPSHTLHTYWIGNLRLVLDVEVHGGKASAGKYSRPRLR